MKVLWTLVKVVLALALAIPVSIILLATALGMLGALVGIAFFVLKIAAIGLVGWGILRVLSHLMRGAGPAPRHRTMEQLPPVDPHYEAAMRELDRELGIR